MIRRTTCAIVCVLSAALPAAAQQGFEPARSLSLYQADALGVPNGSLLSCDAPIALSDGRYFPATSALGSMGAVSLDFVSVAFLTPIQTHRVNRARLADLDGSSGAMDSPESRIYAGGEMGVLYGKSFGKYGGDEFSSYIFGTVGNEHFQITAGAAYQESTTRFPRLRR